MKKIIPVMIIVAVIMLGAIGCSAHQSVANAVTNCVAVQDDNRDVNGELFYGTNNYPEGRRAEMAEQYSALLNK